MENTNKKYVLFGLILGLSLVVSTMIGAFAFYKIRSANYISTTGSATEMVVSDQVKWTSTITRPATISDIKMGYQKMDADLQAVKDFLTANGITTDETDISPVLMNEVYDQNGGIQKNYDLVQTIIVQSNDVQKIADLSKNTSSLVEDKGVIFATTDLEYYYSKLPDARVSLLASAVQDAKARANQLAIAGGQKIGVLESASSGVVQVMAPNSEDVNDYGTYDTSSINKEIMVTVKASFEIK
jgi:hypothetical protein